MSVQVQATQLRKLTTPLQSHRICSRFFNATKQAKVTSRVSGRNLQSMQIVVKRSSFAGAGVAFLLGSSAFVGMQSDRVLFEARGLDGGNGGGSKDSEEDDMIGKLIDRFGPELSQVSFGSVLGFCSGYAIKELGKVAALSVGVVFVAAQLAASKGYIDINWKKIQTEVITAVDPDGDGKITKKDLKIWWKQLSDVLKFNLPSSGGFALGFALGIRCG